VKLVDYLNTVRCELVDIQEQKGEYLKGSLMNLKTDRKNTNIRDLYRGISEFKKGYEPRTNAVKDKKISAGKNCHSILKSWRNHFSPLLNVNVVGDARQIAIHIAKPLVPEPSGFEVEMVIENLKDTNHQISIRFVQRWFNQEVGQFVLRSISLVILFGIRRNCPRGRTICTLYLFMSKVVKVIVLIIEAYHSYQLLAMFHLAPFCQD